MEPKDGLRQILDPSSDFWQVTLGLLGLGLLLVSSWVAKWMYRPYNP